MNEEAASAFQQVLRRYESGSPLLAGWRWLTDRSRNMLQAKAPRRLRVTETVSLGEKRFACLLQVDNECLLVGSSPAGIVLLKQLAAPELQQVAEQVCSDTVAATQVVKHSLKEAAEPLGSSAAPQARVEAGETSGELLVDSGYLTQARVSSFLPSAASAAEALKRQPFPLARIAGPLLAAALLLPVTSRAAPVAPVPALASSTSDAPAQPVQSSGTDSVSPASAKQGSAGLSVSGLGSSSAPWTIVVLLTFLTLIPSLMICMTPFARLLVVFHFLRQALGLQTTPSNQTLIGLSLVLTFFIMEPVGKQIYNNSFLPLQDGKITAIEAVSRGSDPMRRFMAHYVREKDASLFLEIAHAPRPKSIEDVSMRVLMPAYIVSELKAGFQIGAVLFLPFLVVDIVIASITTSVGMMQLPPVVISTPLKLMLFLMVDGWHLLISALVRSFY